MNRFKKDPPFLIITSVTFFSLLAAYCLLFSTFADASSIDEEIAKIQNAYENMKDMSCGFVQKSHIKDLKRTDTYKGEIFIKKPQKMKVIYKGTNPYEVIINNDKVLIYQKKEKQAIRSAFNSEMYGQTPIVLLSGFGKIQEEFSISEINGKLLLKPKKPMGSVVSIEIQPAESGFPINAFTIHDSYSNRIDITLKDVKVNSGLEDKVFEFSLPKGVSILEHNP